MLQKISNQKPTLPSINPLLTCLGISAAAGLIGTATAAQIEAFGVTVGPDYVRPAGKLLTHGGIPKSKSKAN